MARAGKLKRHWDCGMKQPSAFSLSWALCAAPLWLSLSDNTGSCGELYTHIAVLLYTVSRSNVTDCSAATLFLWSSALGSEFSTTAVAQIWDFKGDKFCSFSGSWIYFGLLLEKGLRALIPGKHISFLALPAVLYSHSVRNRQQGVELPLICILNFQDILHAQEPIQNTEVKEKIMSPLTKIRLSPPHCLTESIRLN